MSSAIVLDHRILLAVEVRHTALSLRIRFDHGHRPPAWPTGKLRRALLTP